MRESIGLTPVQAIETIFSITANLANLFAWLVFWIAHLVMAVLALGLLWWFQVSPERVWGLLTGETASVAGAAGRSVLGVLSGYLALAQWVWRRTYVPWQAEQLMRGLR